MGSKGQEGVGQATGGGQLNKVEFGIICGYGAILVIHSFLLIGAVFVVGEVKQRLDELEKRAGIKKGADAQQ